MRRLIPALLLSGLFQFAIFTRAEAETIEISAECHWYGETECKVKCSELAFYSVCEADIDLNCSGKCTDIDIDVDCTGTCEAECTTASCEVDPGSFDCNAYCRGECGASCEGECAANEDKAYCEGECDAFCEGECSAGCSGMPPNIDCQGGCQASCQGKCQADVDFDCHMDCEVDAYANCKTTWTGDCDVACDSDGILECNGEFIGQNDLEAAIKWVEDNTDFVITYEGDADCTGNTCHAEGSASITCGVVPRRSPSLLFYVISLIAK